MRQFYESGTLYGRMRYSPWAVIIFAAFIALLLVGAAQLLVVAIWAAANHLDISKVAAMGEEVLAAHPEVVLLSLAASQVGGFGLAAVLLSSGAGKLRNELAIARPWPLAYAALALLELAIATPAWQYVTFDEKTFILPEVLKGFEQWAIESERSAEKIITAIAGGSVLVNLVVIALVPAICEELFFRGFLQSQLQRVVRPQVAIGLTAFVFSLIHFQAFGFFARWLLGVVFGHLRLWSGSLLPCIAGHFAHNATTVVVLYLATQGMLPAEVTDPAYRVPLWIGLPAVVVAGFLFVLLYVRRKGSAGIAAAPASTQL